VSGGAKPRRLGESVRAVRAGAQPATLLAAVQGCWRAALGERIAAEARPVRERDGVITVECRAATWAQELDLMQDELISRLNQALGEARIAGLRLVVGEFSPSTQNSA
jgi:predicted nucleic acid-binding Zn ribbon protein